LPAQKTNTTNAKEGANQSVQTIVEKPDEFGLKFHFSPPTKKSMTQAWKEGKEAVESQRS